MVAQRTLDPLVQVRILAGQRLIKCETDPWCNGSTADFGSAGPGSNPGGSAKVGGQWPPTFFILTALAQYFVILQLTADFYGFGCLLCPWH